MCKKRAHQAGKQKASNESDPSDLAPKRAGVPLSRVSMEYCIVTVNAPREMNGQRGIWYFTQYLFFMFV